jgi:hypothetical protein
MRLFSNAPRASQGTVSYQIEGRGQYFHTVSSRQAQCSWEAIEAAKRDLGQRD